MEIETNRGDGSSTRRTLDTIMAIEIISRHDFRKGVSRHRRHREQSVRTLVNMRPQSDGSLKTRLAPVTHINLPESNAIWALFGLTSFTTGLHMYSVVHTDGINDTLYVDSSLLAGNPLSSSNYTSIAAYKETIFFSNGVAPINYYIPIDLLPKKWGAEQWGTSQWGEALSRVAVTGDPTPPIGKYMLFYKDRCYIASATGKLYYSNAGMFSALPTVLFPALNLLTVGSSSNPPTGLAIGEDFLVIFTAENYQIMTGTPGDDGGTGDVALQEFSAIGCSIPGSVTALGNRIAFIGTDRRIYELNGSVLTDLDVNDDIKEYLRAPKESAFHAVKASYTFGELWIRIPKAGDPNDARILVYIKSLKIWTVFEDLDGFALTRVVASGRLFLGSSAGVIQELESQSGVAGDISIEMEGRQEVLGSFRRRKKYMKGSLLMDLNPGNSVALSYSLNNTAYTTMNSGATLSKVSVAWGAAKWGAAPWSSTELSHIIFRPAATAVIGREFRLKITGTVSPRTRILNYDLDAEVLPRDDTQ